MTFFSASFDGMRRVNRAPAILTAMWALTLLVGLPLAIALRGMLAQHLGGSLAADAAATGTNYQWMQEFSDQATGLGVTFKPNSLPITARVLTPTGFQPPGTCVSFSLSGSNISSRLAREPSCR